jgi:phage-related minor tail protein
MLTGILCAVGIALCAIIALVMALVVGRAAEVDRNAQNDDRRW